MLITAQRFPQLQGDGGRVDGWIVSVKCHPGVLPGLEANQNHFNSVLTPPDRLGLTNGALTINQWASKT